MVDSTVAVRESAMLADVLDAPVAELAVGDNIDAGKNFIDAWTLVIVHAVLENVLDDETASLSKRDFVPHATQSLVDELHDKRRLSTPAELEQLLPDVACVAVDNGFRNATQELVNHDGLVLLGHAVKSLLDDMTAESVHAEVQSIAADSLSNCHNLLGRAMLEAALDEEIAESVDHQGIGLVDDGLHNVELLLGRAKLQLLLKKDGSLLVIAADNLVDDVAPVAARITVEQTAVVERLNGAHVVLTLRGSLLLRDRLPLTREVRGSR